MLQLGQPAQCSNLINEKLLKPQGSSSQTAVSKYPCVKYCEDVITRCVGRSNLDELSDKWRAYVTILNDLALKLSTTYNIETIISPLDVQISEVIMNIQENGTNITEYVTRACRAEAAAATAVPNSIVAPATSLQAPHQPSIPTNTMHYPANNNGRPGTRRLTKRAAAVASPSRASASRPNPNMHRQATNIHVPSLNGYNTDAGSRARTSIAAAAAPYLLQHPSSAGGPVTHANADGYLANDLTPNGPKPPLVIEEIRNYLQTTKLFFSTLPSAVCISNTTLGTVNASVATKAKPPNCFQESLTLTDMNTDFKFRMDINRQAERLDDMRTKIEQALRGEEIDWTVQTTASNTGSISASVNQQQSHKLVPNNGRPLLSTTSTTPEPTEDDTELTDEVNSEEDGSGDELSENHEESDGMDPDSNNGDSTSTSFDLDEEDDTASENPTTESTDTSDESNISDNNGNSNTNDGANAGENSDNNNDPTLPITKVPADKIPDQNSVEDDSLVTLSPNDLVTVEAGMHKSTGQNSKLVISYRDQILFVMLTCIVVLIVVASFRASRHKVIRMLKSKFENGVESK